MSDFRSIASDPRNKFSVWYRSLSGAALLGAVASIGAGLAVFSVITILMDGQTPNASQTSMTLTAALALFVFGIANLWFTVTLMGFGFRAAQFAKSRGVALRLAPGWAIGGWFVPVASFVLPYLVLKDVASLSGSEASVRQRSILSFWIWWVVLSNLINVGVRLILSQTIEDQLTGWKLFAGTIAFFIVPFMMGRKALGQLDADLRALIV